MKGGEGESKRNLGPDEESDEKKVEMRGRMKRMSRGRRFDNVVERDGGGIFSDVDDVFRGRRRGWAPPNWWTRKPGPPPRLKTNCGPVSKSPPPPPAIGSK